MTPEQRAIEAAVLHQNLVDYWYEVDVSGGEAVASMYLEDGVFHAGPGKPLVGREAIAQFYAWRVDRGSRISRHVVTNFRATFADPRHATTYHVMLLYAADGQPILPSAPPIFIGDGIDTCVKGDDGIWRYKERGFTPLFMGGVAPTVPPDSIAETHNAKAQSGKTAS